MEDRACVSEKLTVILKLRRFYANKKHHAYMVLHAIFWRTLFKLRIGWAYQRLLCRTNLSKKFPDGRCGFCGINH